MSGKVLIVDDSAQARGALKEALGQVFNDFVEADDGLSAIKAFVDERPGFIITDIEMPSINGFRFISTVRNMGDGRDVPVIMLSGSRNSLKNKLTGFNLGASDFLIKPFENDELIARVKSLLRVRNLLDELKEKNALLEKLVVTDELTGLHNRRHFFESARERIALGLRHNFKAACLLIDIDHFKKINDTWGHIAGDDILRTVGRLLASCRREGELVARFGGEEFVLCLFNTDSESAYLAAERFRSLIGEREFTSSHHPPMKISVSVGLAIYPQDAVVTLDDLIKAADAAMYRAKSGGRDRVAVYEWPANPSKKPRPAGSLDPMTG